jgi:hypothetical protein
MMKLHPLERPPQLQKLIYNDDLMFSVNLVHIGVPELARQS